MAADESYQNVVHKRMGGKLFVIPTGCTGVVESGGKLDLADGSTMTISGEINVASSGVINLASGAVLKIGGTNYIDTAGRVVQQFENKTSGDDGTALINYGVSYLNTTGTASTFYLPAGTANVTKTIVVGLSSVVNTIKTSSTGTIIYNISSASTFTTITGSSGLTATVQLISKSTAIWHVLGALSTGLTIT